MLPRRRVAVVGGAKKYVSRLHWPDEMEVIHYGSTRDEGFGEIKRLKSALTSGRIDVAILLTSFVGHNLMNVMRQFEGRVPFTYFNETPKKLSKEMTAMVAQLLPQKLEPQSSPKPKRAMVPTRPAKEMTPVVTQILDEAMGQLPLLAPPSKKGRGGRSPAWTKEELTAMDLALDENRLYAGVRGFYNRVAITYCELMRDQNSRAIEAIKQRARFSFMEKKSASTPIAAPEPVVVAPAPVVVPVPSPAPCEVVEAAPQPTTPSSPDQQQLRLVPPMDQNALYKQWVMKFLELQQEMDAAGVATAFMGRSGHLQIKKRKKPTK